MFPYSRVPSTKSINSQYTTYTGFRQTKNKNNNIVKTTQSIMTQRGSKSIKNMSDFSYLQERTPIKDKKIEQKFYLKSKKQFKLGNYNKTFNEEIRKKQIEKRQEDFWLFFTSRQNPKDQIKKQKDSQSTEITSTLVIAENFKDSFRIVFSSYIELYYKKVALASHVKRRPTMFFNYLLQFSDNQHFQSHVKLNIDKLEQAIFRIIQSSGKGYRIEQIRYGLSKKLKGKISVNATELAAAIKTHQNESCLINDDFSRSILGMQFPEIVKEFFEVFVQFYDTEIKLKRICKANPKNLLKLITEVSTKSQINLEMMGNFLYHNEKKSKKLLFLRFEEFFQTNYGKRDNLIFFLTWIKQLDY